jgi:SNF2 family DNA or RNA helicase
MQEQESRLVSKLHAILDPFVLRRLKNDVVLSLSASITVLYTRLLFVEGLWKE